MASTYLSRTPSSTGNRRKFTFSAWIKFNFNQLANNSRIFGCGSATSAWVSAYINADATLQLAIVEGGNTYSIQTNRKFRDESAWYHVVFVVDTENATADNRLRIYVNGQEETSLAQRVNPTQDLDTQANTASKPIDIGSAENIGYSPRYFPGIMSHVHMTDGYVYSASNFGSTDSTTGEWNINTSPSVTYGTNGFFILKDGNSVTDQSPNTNNFTVAGGTLTKTEDCPSNVFPTLNPLLTHAAHGYSLTIGLGNNKITFNEPSTWTYSTSTIAGINGKFYAEFKVDAVGSEASIGVIASDTVNVNQTSGGLDDYLGKETDSIGYFNDGRIYNNNSQGQTGLTSFTSGTIVGVAMDLDNNTVQFYNNGSTVGNTVSISADKFYHFGVSGYNSTQISCNFGNGYFGTTAVSSAGTNASGIGIFEFDVPTNYRALSTKGLNL